MSKYEVNFAARFMWPQVITLHDTKQEIEGLTDKTIPRKYGPKRASKIRKLFNLDKKDDPRRYVVKRPLSGKEGKKPIKKAPKIQRLITPSNLQVTAHKWLFIMNFSYYFFYISSFSYISHITHISDILLY